MDLQELKNALQIFSTEELYPKKYIYLLKLIKNVYEIDVGLELFEYNKNLSKLKKMSQEINFLSEWGTFYNSKNAWNSTYLKYLSKFNNNKNLLKEIASKNKDINSTFIKNSNINSILRYDTGYYFLLTKNKNNYKLECKYNILTFLSAFINREIDIDDTITFGDCRKININRSYY